MTLRAGIVLVHRRASLFAALLWLLQAATGLFAVFHWEIDDATVTGEARALDLAAIERRAAVLAAPGSGFALDSIWTTAGAPNRFDIFLTAVSATAAGQVVRIDGSGEILRRREDGERLTNGGLVETLVVLHQSLLAGAAGKGLVGGSGLLLLANIVFGAFLAWPRAGQWRRVLRPGGASPGAARLYSWHRALGLWATLPAICLVSAGVLLAFEERIERWIGAEPVAPPALAMPSDATPGVGLATATEIALARYPGAALSGIGFPSAESAWWAIRLRQPGELRRAYGKTRVYVSALDGAIGADFDALRAAPARRFVDSLFSFHSGEMGGRAGRLGVAAVGLWLAAMNILGLRLWSARRELRRGNSARSLRRSPRPSPRPSPRRP